MAANLADKAGHYARRELRPQPERLTAATKCLEIEACPIQAARVKFNENLFRALEFIRRHPGSLIVSGLGYSGHAGKKIAATRHGGGIGGVCANRDPRLWFPGEASESEMLNLVAFEGHAIATDRHHGQCGFAVRGVRSGKIHHLPGSPPVLRFSDHSPLAVETERTRAGRFRAFCVALFCIAI